MQFIVLDLEWNQALSGKPYKRDDLTLAGEIIQIGAVKLDDSLRIVDSLRICVAPKYYKKMHNKVAALTGIHDSDLLCSGIPFPQAYAQFVGWCGEEYILMSWSMSDLPVLIDNMIIHGIDVSDLPECCDVQRIFSREIMRGNTRYSLDTALTLLKERGDVAHDALNDARNTAKVCDHLDLDQYLGEYTSKVFAEPSNGKVYESRRDMLADPSLRQFACLWCGQMVMCEPWVSSGDNTYMSDGVCPEGDEFLAQLSTAHHQRRSYSAKRIVFEMSDDLWDVYMDNKEALGV
jgi:DNA polymerase III epsilon subunit-like protein